MNKDVIYIEPEDDITDILTEIKGSKAKVVALVPPKKAGVLKSAVNFKLLARTAKETSKAVVLVTSDSALLKLAAAAEIPVAKNLQSKPEVPGGDESEDESEIEGSDVIDAEEAAALAKKEKKDIKADEETVVESVELEEAESEDADKEQKKTKKKSKVPNFDKYRKLIIIGAIGLILIIGFLVWALVIAPSAKIMVAVRTTARPFSEAVSFTTDTNKQDVDGGVFLLEKHSITKESSVDFEATGELDKGVKAAGTLTLKRTSPVSSSNANAITIASGTKFTIDGKSYIATETGTLAKVDTSNCAPILFSSNCNLTSEVSSTIKVMAEVAGINHNISATTSGWAPTSSAYSISGSAMTGGTTNIVKVVSAEDVAKAKEKLASASASEGRAELLSEFPVGLIAISTSFTTQADDPVATPAIGTEVSADITPKLVAKTVFTMFGVDRVRISEYIESKTKQAISGESGQVVYSTGVSDNADQNKAFIESFRDTNGVYTARLKTTTKIGPEVTNQMVLDKSLGRKIGEVQSLLKSVNGISKVEINTSFFWVTSIPNDINKVSVEITVE